VYRPAPELAKTESRVHNEAQVAANTRGTSNQRNHQKTKKKAAAIKKANEKFIFDSIISTALVDNEIAISLQTLEHKYLDEIDEHIDGPISDRFTKYQQMSREECIKSALERREYVRALLYARLEKYLAKRSTKINLHIHYCNAAASAQRFLRRFSGSF
jgi:hypothetical protein